MFVVFFLIIFFFRSPYSYISEAREKVNNTEKKCD